MRSLTRASFLVIATIVYGGTLHAQHFIDLRSVSVTGEDWPPDQRAHSLIIDSVITAFDPTAPIGAIYRGVENIPTPAFIKGDLRTELKAVLERLHTGGAEGRHLVMKIDTLDVTERTLSASETAHCRFSAQMLEHTDKGWTCLYSFGTTLMRRGGTNATDKHAENIVHALDNCLRRTVKMLADPGHQALPVTVERLSTPFKRRLPDLRSMTGERPLRGVYYSYMDFVDGTPDSTTAFTLKETANSMALRRVVKPKNANWDLKAWGLSDGERLYVNTGREYNEVTISRSGMHTYWTPYGPGTSNGSDVLAAGMMFGAIGGALAGAAAGAAAGKESPVRLDIDMNAGTLSRTHKPASKTRESEHWFCYSHHSSVDTTACLLIYGGEEGCLRKGQYHVVRLVPRPEAVPIELQVGDQHVSVTMDTNAGRDQVYLIIVKDDVVKVDLLNATQASDVLNKLQPEDEVK